MAEVGSENKDKLIIFKREQLQQLQKTQRKRYTLPLQAVTMFALSVFLFKRLNLGKMLSNPLAMPIKQQNNSKRSSYLYFHSLLFLGLGSWIGAVIAGEIKKFSLYDKYKRQVSFYVMWKMEEEIKKQL